MTAQVSETLIYHGKELMMFSNPLDPYLRAAGLHFESMNTANWRGYEGTWEIKGSEATGEGLYLVRLEANRSFDEIVGLAEIFPGFPDGVFAHWFSGEIRLPKVIYWNTFMGAMPVSMNTTSFWRLRRV